MLAPPAMPNTALCRLSHLCPYPCRRHRWRPMSRQNSMEGAGRRFHLVSVVVVVVVAAVVVAVLAHFANVAYVETAPNDAGQPEMIITRLKLHDFPFIRYKMKDIADVEFRQYPDGTEKYVITKIEGKDSNFIMSDRGERFYPSFFNGFVNELNGLVDDSIIEIKVYERGQKELEIQ